MSLRLPVPQNALRRNGGRSGDLVYFGIDDLLLYARHYKTLSGIQRVQVGVIAHLLEQLERTPDRYAFVFGSADWDGLWQARADDLKRLVDCLTGDRLDLPRQIAVANYIEQNSVAIEPEPGATYFILGAFWAFNGDTSRYARLKRAGVAIGTYIYDFIPITHPEFCTEGLTDGFTLAIGDGFAVFDFVLTISEFTAREVRRFQEKHNLRRVPVEAVPLAHLLQDKAPPPADWSGTIAKLRDRPFVLMVSSIEPRKNHAYLVTVWKQFLEEGLDPPDLVFAGRYGWLITDFKAQLEATNFLDGRVHVLHDLSDAELERLYQSCLFTAFPSVVEGWGLPVGESLTHGRPCVASSATSIPEVGGDLVDYVDPFNIRAGIEVFRRMAFDAEYRARREADVRARFRARTWRDVGTELVDAIGRLRPARIEPYREPLLKAGELFLPALLGHGRRTSPQYPTRPLRPIVAEGWYPPGDLGAALRGTEGVLRFRAELAAGTGIVAYLQMRAAEWSANQMLELAIGAPVPESLEAPAPVLPRDAYPPCAQTHEGGFPLRADALTLCRAAGRVGSDGIVEIWFRLRGHAPIPDAEPRNSWVSLVCLAYAETDDVDQRAAILESFVDLAADDDRKRAAVDEERPRVKKKGE